jgi:hypothetical protein
MLIPVQLTRVNELNFRPTLLIAQARDPQSWVCNRITRQCLKPFAQMIGSTLVDDETQTDLRDPCAHLLNLQSSGSSGNNIGPNTYKFLEGRRMQRATHNGCFLHVYTENRIAIIVMAAMTMFFCRNCSSSLHS